jgi:hypothetical protein
MRDRLALSIIIRSDRLSFPGFCGRRRPVQLWESSMRIALPGSEIRGRILKGAEAMICRFSQAVKVGSCANARTAKSLGLTLPTSVLLRANEVIE